MTAKQKKPILTNAQRAALDVLVIHGIARLGDDFGAGTLRALVVRRLIAHTGKSPSFSSARYYLTRAGRAAVDA